jgi:hypothetical protein
MITALVATSAAIAGEYSFAAPSDDRWYYPHNFTPGTRPIGSVFSGVFTNSNDLRGYNILVWDTTTTVTPGSGSDNYNVRAVIVTQTNHKDYADWPVDLTVDDWFTMDIDYDGFINADGIPRGEPGDTDGESDDEDPGRPIQLTGAGFGPTYDRSTWLDTDIYIGDGGNPCDPFPFVYQDDTLELLHIEDHVKGLHNDLLATPVYSFTPIPWAIGEPIGYTPGAQTTDFDVEFTVDLTLSDCEVRRYFQRELDAGRVAVIISSMQEADHDTPVTDYNRFFMREALNYPAAFPTAKAPHLTIVLATVPGDFDGDDDVDQDDIDYFVDCSTGPALGPPTCECEVADFDDDDDVDQNDLGLLQRCITGSGVPGDANCLGSL